MVIKLSKVPLPIYRMIEVRVILEALPTKDDFIGRSTPHGEGIPHHTPLKVNQQFTNLRIDYCDAGPLCGAPKKLTYLF